MAITKALTDDYKEALATAGIDHTNGTGHAFKLGLFKGTATGTYGAGTTTYTEIATTNSDEASVTNGTGYTAGGIALTNVTPTSASATLLIDWTETATGTTNFDVVWTLAQTTPTVSMTTDGCFIWDDTHASDVVVAVWPFAGAPLTATGADATITITLPGVGASTSLIRLA